MVFMKKHFYLLFTILIFLFSGFDILADSIAGSKMEITHVSGDTYKITVTLFVDETPSTITSTAGPSLYTSATMPWIRLYKKGATAAGDVLSIEKQLTFDKKEPFLYDGIQCVPSTSKTLATQKIILSTTVSLPGASFNNALGYYIVYQDGYRNPSDNIVSSNNTGITLYTEFPSLASGKNSSPVFKLVKGIVACKGTSYSIDLGAVDADGNTMSYMSSTPYSGPGYLTLSNKNAIKPVPRNPSAVDYYPYAAWSGGFSASNPIPGLSLNASTGVLSGTPTQEGTFIISVECKEFNGSTQIGVIRQDVEIRVEKICVTPDPIIYLPGGNPSIHVTNVEICEFSFRILETADVALATYQWFKNAVQVPGATKNKIKILFAEAGLYTVEVTRNGAGTCAGTKMSQTTQLNPQNGSNVKLDIAKKDYCVGESFIININVTVLPLPPGSVNKWFKDGVQIPGIPFPANAYPVGSSALADSGLYRLEVTENAGYRCVYEDSVKIKIIPVPIAVITNLTAQTVVCSGKVVILQATANPNVTYEWKKNSIYESNAPLINISNPGSYDLIVTSTINPTCFATAAAPVVITVNPNPLVTFAPIPPVCNAKGAKVNLLNLVNLQSPVGVFSGTGVRGSEFDPSLAGYGSFPITYTYKTSLGCPGNIVSQNAVVDVTPVIKLGNDITIFSGDTVRIKSAGSSGSQYIYEWTPIAGVLAPFTSPQPLVSPVASTLYKVKVTSVLGGCNNGDDIYITVRPRLKFANAFTPNNDAINDTWEIEGIGGYASPEITIFNRWGGQIFYSIGYTQAFDGIQNNERLPAGTYFYVIKPSSDVPTLTGYLTIVR